MSRIQVTVSGGKSLELIMQDLRILLLLLPGEGGDEGIDKEKCLIFNPLTVAPSPRERGLKILTDMLYR
jgi:hypothetical protein